MRSSAQKLSRKSRITKRQDFIHLKRHGKRIYGKNFILNYCKNEWAESRLGITVSRRVGNAVTRNRIKRYCREFFRLNRNRLDGNWDINIIAKTEASARASQEVSKDLKAMFNQLSG